MGIMLTQAQAAEQARSELEHLIEFAGNQAHLARMLNVASYIVAGWVRRGKVSVDGVERIVNHPVLGLHFSASQLRPDLYV